MGAAYAAETVQGHHGRPRAYEWVGSSQSRSWGVSQPRPLSGRTRTRWPWLKGEFFRSRKRRFPAGEREILSQPEKRKIIDSPLPRPSPPVTQVPTGKMSTFVFDVIKEKLKKKYSSFQGGQIKTRLKKLAKTNLRQRCFTNSEGSKNRFYSLCGRKLVFSKKIQQKGKWSYKQRN